MANLVQRVRTLITSNLLAVAGHLRAGDCGMKDGSQEVCQGRLGGRKAPGGSQPAAAGAARRAGRCVHQKQNNAIFL